MKALITAPENTAVVADVDVPEPGRNEVRIKVHSLALNPVDSLYVGSPVAPPGRIVGSDFSGTVEKIGEGVTQWKIGDRVTGFNQGATSGNPRPGSFAEFAILEADLTIAIPSGVSFEEAATVPLCSLTAVQTLFIQLGLNAPFPNPIKCDFKADAESPAILIYSAATSIGMYAIELARVARTPTGKPYRIFATASPKNHARLLAKGVEAVFDYRSLTWPEDARKASGGIAGAVDCISEDESTAKISQAFGDSGGTIAVLRHAAWSRDGVKENVTPKYSAVWAGLGHPILYNNGREPTPPDPAWRTVTVEYYKFLSKGSPADASKFPIEPNPLRVMPGGLERMVHDGFELLGWDKVVERGHETRSEPWMKPISGEKVVYHIHE